MSLEKFSSAWTPALQKSAFSPLMPLVQRALTGLGGQAPAPQGGPSEGGGGLGSMLNTAYDYWNQNGLSGGLSQAGDAIRGMFGGGAAQPGAAPRGGLAGRIAGAINPAAGVASMAAPAVNTAADYWGRHGLVGGVKNFLGMNNAPTPPSAAPQQAPAAPPPVYNQRTGTRGDWI